MRDVGLAGSTSLVGGDSMLAEASGLTCGDGLKWGVGSGNKVRAKESATTLGSGSSAVLSSCSVPEFNGNSAALVACEGSIEVIDIVRVGRPGKEEGGRTIGMISSEAREKGSSLVGVAMEDAGSSVVTRVVCSVAVVGSEG